MVSFARNPETDEGASDMSPVEPTAKASEVLDADALRLASLGYSQEMQRKFSVWSALGVGFSLTNSWFGISAALVTGINSGGPVLIVYGVMLVGIVSVGVGISLSELSSAMPSAGGQYYWAGELAPRRWAGLASFLTGWFAWAGSIFTSAAVALALASACVGCYVLGHPDFEYSTWNVVVTYQTINAFAFLFNCYGRTLPFVASTTLYISMVSFVVLIITVPVVAPTHQSARFVFATFINNTGWAQNGIAFIVGIPNTNWAFACLDCATHLAEEVAQPERTIPKVIMGTIAIGFVTAWLFGITMFFSIVGDFEALIHTRTGVPILELFNKALTGRAAQTAGAIVLESLIIGTGIGCLIASHTWQSRLCWSFARDGGIPFSRYHAKIDKRLDVPFRAHLTSSIIVAAVGCLYLGSHTAFNSMVTACIVLLYISYAIPVICLLVRGRDNIAHGPFWLGPVGLVSNWVLLAWTLFTLVMYAFPYQMPVTAKNMNYVSAVYGIILAIISGDWLFRGRVQYRRNEKQDESVEGITSESIDHRTSSSDDGRDYEQRSERGFV